MGDGNESFVVMRRVFTLIAEIAVGIIALCILPFALALLGIGFQYRIPVYNDPLNAPVIVASVSDHRLELADGRVVEIAANMRGKPLDDLIRDAGYKVDLEFNNSTVSVFARCKRFYCGTGRPRMIVPLIPVRYQVYDRCVIATGKIVP